MKIKNLKFKIITIIAVALLSYGVFIFFNNSSRELNFNTAKPISINDNGLLFETSTTTKSINDLLQEKKIVLGEHDAIIPNKDSLIYPGIIINIDRAVKINIAVDGKNIENYSTQKTIGGVLKENDVILGRLDKVLPEENSHPPIDAKIIVTRINVEEKIITEDIPFKTIHKEDAKLGWREEKTEQKGELGKIDIKYKITYKDNKEISRVALEKNITQEPVTEIITKGTYMQLGKANSGQGTWYAFKGGLFAASTSLPRGSYARVTNQANGKSVIVQINDYGPQGKGRIIDLDKVAFMKIASLGAGVIGVKVEAILN